MLCQQNGFTFYVWSFRALRSYIALTRKSNAFLGRRLAREKLPVAPNGV